MICYLMNIINKLNVSIVFSSISSPCESSNLMGPYPNLFPNPAGQIQLYLVLTKPIRSIRKKKKKNTQPLFLKKFKNKAGV